MESLGLYLFKSTIWLTGFALVFFIALRNEHYFRLNRVYLLLGIIASILFPLFSWHYSVIIPSVPDAEISVSGLSAVAVEQGSRLPSILGWFYLGIITFLVFRLVRQIWRVIRIIRKAGYQRDESVKLVRTIDYVSSFSFFSFVFVNPSISNTELKEIVNHERVHIQQCHWFDLLFVELLCMMQWFNPFVWIYAWMLRQNHEYLADEKALQTTSDPAVYQATLLNQMLGAPVIRLANSFNYSLNKKRFKMMKKSISSPFRKLKVLLVLPFIGLVFYAFAKPEYVTLPSDVQGVALDQVNQVRSVRGKVIRESDAKSLHGASVIIAGTTNGTLTDEDGNFKLEDVPANADIVVSFVGLKTVKIKANFEHLMLVNMVGESIGVDEVVVVGYGDPSDSKPEKPVSDQKKIDSHKNPPLYLVDGDIVNYEEVKRINPEEIQSINVIKDKTAVERFGENGKNGAVMITMKKKDADVPVENVHSVKASSSVEKQGNDKPVFVVVEDMPQFPGGEMALRTFIAQTVKYPVEAQIKKIEGKVFVTFVVNSEGRVEDAKIARSVDPLLDAEAIRVVNLSPQWKPGKQRGKEVAVSYTIPIQFKLQ